MIHNIQRSKGYTLIEILIVLFIISIVTSVALLSIGRNENKRLESFANEFTQIMMLAEEQAMLQPAVLGVSMASHSYNFVTYRTGSGPEKNPWIPLRDTILGKHKIPEGIQVGLEVGGKHLVTDAPQIIISTNGDVTPFTIYVGKAGKKPRYVIRGEADGNVSKQLLS